MTGTLSLVSVSGSEPITLAEAKAHLRETREDDDALVQAFITVGREFVEHDTDRAIREQRWTLTRPAFPDGREPIWIPKPPLIEVVSVTYRDTAGVAQTWAADQYLVLAPQGPTAQPAQIVPAPGVQYPCTQVRPDAVVVEFRCGYARQSDVPVSVTAALLLMLGHLYENREAVSVGVAAAPLPLGVEALLAPYRVVSLV